MKLAVPMLACALIAAAAASAKEIRPGDLRICGAKSCRAVNDPVTARAFGEFFYGRSRVFRAPTPRLGSPVVRVRFSNGFVAGVLTATAIRVNGVDCERFHGSNWYRLPAKLRGLTAGLEPRRLGARAPRTC